MALEGLFYDDPDDGRESVLCVELDGDTRPVSVAAPPPSSRLKSLTFIGVLLPPGVCMYVFMSCVHVNMQGRRDTSSLHLEG